MTLRKTLIACLMLLFVASTVKAGEEYQIDRSHSRIGFAVKHMLVTTVRGNFKEFNVTINYDADDITKSSVNANIVTASVDTDNERRDNHLRSDDFFNAEKFPEIVFVSKKIVKNGDGHILVGDLTIRDITKEVEMPFEITDVLTSDRGNRFGFSARLTINRMDYGVRWDRTMDTGGLIAGEEVTIEIDGAAVQRKDKSSN